MPRGCSTRLGALALMAVLWAGCSRPAPAEGVLLTIEAPEGVPTSAEVRLSWLGGEGFIFRDRPVFVAAERTDGAKVLGTVFVERGDAPSDVRRIIGRAVAGGATVLEGAVRIRLTAGQTAARLKLLPRPMSDADEDGLPDDVDDCPNWSDGEGRCGTARDAGGGAPPDAMPPSDTASADVAPGLDAPAPRDVGTDPPSMQDAGVPDARATDAAPATPTPDAGTCPPPEGAGCPSGARFTFDRDTEGFAVLRHAGIITAHTCSRTYCGAGALAIQGKLGYPGDRHASVERALSPREHLLGKTVTAYLFVDPYVAGSPLQAQTYYIGKDGWWKLIARKTLVGGWNVVSGMVTDANSDQVRLLGAEVYLERQPTTWTGRVLLDELGWK